MVLKTTPTAAAFAQRQRQRAEAGTAGNRERKWGVHEIRDPQNGWFIMAKLIKIDDLGVPYFRKPPDGVPWRVNH